MASRARLPAGASVDGRPALVPCLATGARSMTLISQAGFHCDVWRSAGKVLRNGRERTFDVVVKQYREVCNFYEARVYQRDYMRLRTRLKDLVPKAAFILTEFAGDTRLIALAQTCEPWFDLANPGNEETARSILSRYRGPRAELSRFVRAGFEWLEAPDARVIDLHGHGNLVLDRSYHVRYLDSFGTFFYPDLLVAVAEPDRDLEDKIRVSTERLLYLRRLLRFTRDAGAGTLSNVD